MAAKKSKSSKKDGVVALSGDCDIIRLSDKYALTLKQGYRICLIEATPQGPVQVGNELHIP